MTLTVQDQDGLLVNIELINTRKYKVLFPSTSMKYVVRGVPYFVDKSLFNLHMTPYNISSTIYGPSDEPSNYLVKISPLALSIKHAPRAK